MTTPLSIKRASNMGSRMFKGVNRAAESLAADTGRVMAEIREDVRQVKDRLLTEVLPNVQELIKDTQTFVVTGTFTIKVLALLLIVLVLYVLKKQMTPHKNTKSRSKARSVVSNAEDLVLSLESIFLTLIFWTCLLMAIVLAIHLVQEIFHIANVGSFWPANFPFIVVIPSLATVAVILQHMRAIILAISNAILLLVYLLFGLPLTMTFHPISAGISYAQSSALLFFVILITGPALYCVILILPVCYLKEVYKLNFSLVEFILLAYLIFFVTSIVINIMTEVLLKILIRPLWSCRSQQRMLQ